MDVKPLFVRLPVAQAEALDVACARLRTTKQALVGSLVASHLGVGAAMVATAAPPAVLTFDELVELFGLPAEVVRERVSSGEIPGRRFGDDWRFARHAVLDWLAGTDAARSTGFRAAP